VKVKKRSNVKKGLKNTGTTVMSEKYQVPVEKKKSCKRKNHVQLRENKNK
jgi:hypothetical protein